MSNTFSVTTEISTRWITSDRNLLSEVPGFTTLDPCVRTVLSYCIDENYYPECPPQNNLAITDSISCLCHSARTQVIEDMGSWSCNSNLQTAAQAFFVNTYCPMNDVGALVPVTVPATSTNAPESTRTVTVSTSVPYTTTVSCTNTASTSSVPSASDNNCSQDSSPCYACGGGGVMSVFIIAYCICYCFSWGPAYEKKRSRTEPTSIVQNHLSITVITQPESALVAPRSTTYCEQLTSTIGSLQQSQSRVNGVGKEKNDQDGEVAQAAATGDRQVGEIPDDPGSESINSDSSASHVLHYIERPQRAQLRDSDPPDKTNSATTI